MYDYPQYKEQDRGKVIEFMKAHPFVTLAGTDKSGRIELTQVPVLIKEQDKKLFIVGHIARKSEHHKAFTSGNEVLALFTSPHTYVSGSWYKGNPQQASTWNYISIHARGAIEFGTEDELRDLLREFTLHFENGNASSSTVYDNLPADYIEKLIKAIVPFKIEVTELENVFKLSQNRDKESYLNIMDKLDQQGEDGKFIAQKMKERQDGLFD